MSVVPWLAAGRARLGEATVLGGRSIRQPANVFVRISPRLPRPLGKNPSFAVSVVAVSVNAHSKASSWEERADIVMTEVVASCTTVM